MEDSELKLNSNIESLDGAVSETPVAQHGKYT